MDLWVGYGLAYLVSIPALFAAAAWSGFDGGWLRTTPILALLFATPHYGATILRVYETRESRHRYALFSYGVTGLMIALFLVGLFDVGVGRLLLTAYVTWSPWHFSGQNYGLGVMYLRRRRIPFEERDKRLLYTSFVLSAVLAMLAIHLDSSTLVFAQGAADASGIFSVWSLRIPRTLGLGLAAAVSVAYLGCLAAFAVRVGRRAPLHALAPVGLLVLNQALWFVLPALTGVTGLATTRSFAFDAIWISTAHSIQYLWVTTYYVERSALSRGARSFVLRSLLVGASLSLPAVAFAPGLLGRVSPTSAGIAVLMFSAINLHHFLLDGAIWKLRDGRVARTLLRGSAPVEPAPGSRAAGAWIWRAVLAAGLLVLVFEGYVLWLGSRVESRVMPAAELRTVASELAWMGRDSAKLWAVVGERFESEGRSDGAIDAYRRALSMEKPPRPGVASRLAWLLLERDPVDPKDAAQATALASYLVRALPPDRPEGFQTLAAAHAAAGRWSEAVAAGERAGSIARDRGDEDRARLMEQRVSEYRRRALAARPPELPAAGRPVSATSP